MTATTNSIDLYLLGAGVAFPDHLTVQTIEILAACNRICTNLPESRLAMLPADISERCVSLWPLYQDGRIRKDNYRDVTQAVLDEAQRGRPIAWLTPGHPMIFDSVSKALFEAAHHRGWHVSVIPAISSLDTLLAEVAYDPAGGLVVHDSTSLVRRKVPIVNSAALVLLQIGVFLSDRAHISLSGDSPDLTPLRDYLLEYFPAEHACAVVRSSAVLSQPPNLTWVAVSDLPSVPVDVFSGASLFIPPKRQDRA